GGLAAARRKRGQQQRKRAAPCRRSAHNGAPVWLEPVHLSTTPCGTARTVLPSHCVRVPPASPADKDWVTLIEAAVQSPGSAKGGPAERKSIQRRSGASVRQCNRIDVTSVIGFATVGGTAVAKKAIRIR